MMSWGDHSQFDYRDSRREPTKSAVIGILCAALGRPRWEPVDDLAALKMGVRVNKEGILRKDFHTVQCEPKPEVSERYYVADGDYLVGLEGDSNLLRTLDQALQKPHWQVFLGRKSFIPSRPLRVGLVEKPLLEALRQHPYECSKRGKRPSQLRFVLEVSESLDVRQDVPLSWQPRRFGCRAVKTEYHELPEAICIFPG